MSTALKNLRIAFASAYDEAGLRSLFKENICKNNGLGLDLLGQGTHFRAFRVRGADGTDLVIKRALPHFGGGHDSPGRQAWLKALTALKPLVGQTPLLAPWAVLEADKELGLAMPFGPDPAAAAAAEWLPLERTRAALAAQLAAAGLEIADQLQLRCRGGVPFVIDLSDLRRTSSGSR